MIEQRIAQYSKEEIRFNLMAVVKDRRLVCQKQIDEFQKMLDGKFVSGGKTRARSERCLIANEVPWIVLLLAFIYFFCEID